MTARAAFRPRPGTIGAKMLAHLQSLPAGTRLASAALAEAIGQPGDTRNLLAGAARYLETGLLKDGWIEGTRHRWWALGDGVPPALAKPDEDDEDRADVGGPAPLERGRDPLPDPAIGSIFTLARATAAAPGGALVTAEAAPVRLPATVNVLNWQAAAQPCAPQADPALEAKFDAMLAPMSFGSRVPRKKRPTRARTASSPPTTPRTAFWPRESPRRGPTPEAPDAAARFANGPSVATSPGSYSRN